MADFSTLPTVPVCSDESVADPRGALAHALDALAMLVAAVDDRTYAAGLAVGFSSPLGAHVRHCIDHVDALLNGTTYGEIHYDRRERGTAMEAERTIGLVAVADRARQVRLISDASLRSAIVVEAIVAPGAMPLRFESTVAREVLYVLHHTVHHTALMSALASNLGNPVDPALGRAPATLAHEAGR